MKKVIFVVYVLCLLGIFSACTTLRSVSFERMQAADVNFPAQIRSVGVVNNMPLGAQMGEEVKYDSLGLEADGKFAAEALAQDIAATNYFNQVIICDSALRGHVSLSDTEQPLSVDKVDSLAQILGVDMLFSVERVHVTLRPSSLFYPELMAEMPVLEGVITPLVRTYIPGRHTPLFSVSKTDTICWEMSPQLTYSQIMKDASTHSSILLMDYLLPHWEEMERFYFDGGSMDMRDAGVYVREQNWQEAAALWKRLYDSKKGKTKMHAAYNLAVYHEMQDEYELAKEYLDVAASLVKAGSWEHQLIVFYGMQLEDQSRQNQRLKMQMKRFEP